MENIVIIGDFGKDLDDEHALVLAAGLQKAGYLNLVAVVGNLHPAIDRASIAKGTLKKLGLTEVPVGIGLPVFKGVKYPYETAPYASRNGLLEGQSLLKEVLKKAQPQSVTIVCNSGLSDAAELLRNHEQLFVEKVKQVAIMGGVQADDDKVILTGKFIQPDDASNNLFNWADAAWLYARLQELGVPSVITTRNAAYGCQVPFSIYDKMEETGNPIGACLKARQVCSLEHLWRAACAPEGSKERGTLPPRCDRNWFVKIFCGGKDPGNVTEIWPHTGRFNLYDPINLISAVPELRIKFFDGIPINVSGTRHIIVGISMKKNGIREESKLRQFIESSELSGLSS